MGAGSTRTISPGQPSIGRAFGGRSWSLWIGTHTHTHTLYRKLAVVLDPQSVQSLSTRHFVRVIRCTTVTHHDVIYPSTFALSGKLFPP